MKISGSQPRVRTCHIGEAALGTNDAILADTAMDAADPTVIAVDYLAGQPDVPRNLTVKGNDANVPGGLEIAGPNAFGEERQCVGEGKRVSVPVALGGCRILK